MQTLPAWLLSEETGQPFSHCLGCRLPLLEIDAPWLVTKDYRHGECVLEYAICQHCRNHVATGFSSSSKAAVREFLETRIDWKARLADFMMDATLECRVEGCIACRTPREAATGFGISALFDSSGSPVVGPLPLLICEACTRTLIAGVSPESLAHWQAFLSGRLEGPPGDYYPGLL